MFPQIKYIDGAAGRVII